MRAYADMHDTSIHFADVLKIVYPGACDASLQKMVESVKHKVEEVKPKEICTEAEAVDFDEMWAMWDADGSGELDKKELREALRMLGVELDEDFDDFYQELDQDGSGTIDKKEFQAWWFLEDVGLQEALVRGRDAMQKGS